MSLNSLFTPTQLGAITIPNRILMAPMTRSRSLPNGTPTPEMVDYYTQRASAGLLITEGVQPSYDGQGYCRSPGLHTDEHQKTWAKIASSVNDAGGQMVMQLMHVGRVASHLNKMPGARTLAPSAIPAAGTIFTAQEGMAEHDAPIEMTLDDISQTITDYVNAAKRARAAGIAGVELHVTSGYLPAQFLSTGSNHRTDAYGGSLNGRLKFTVDLLGELANAIGADRVGFRICPGNPFNDLQDDNPTETFSALLQAVNPLNLAYLHVIRMPATGIDTLALAEEHFKGALVFNESISAEEAAQMIDAGRCAAVAFGRDFIGNPDLVARLRNGWPLSKFSGRTLYSAGPEGYSDYPVYSE